MLLLVAVPFLLLAIGLLYQWVGARRDLVSYPPPGELINVNGVRMHLRRTGDGTPTVIFEAGIAASSVSWAPVQDAIADVTSTASYDRAGLAWSAASPATLTAPEMTEALRQLLASAGLSPPFVLVGHSFGAFLVRLYAARWPDDVAGVVVVDPALVSEWASPAPERLKMLGRGVGLSRRGALLARIGFVRLSLAMLAGGARALPMFISKLTSGKGHGVSSKLVGEVRKLPPELWPAVQSHWCRPESFESMARHLEALPATAALVGKTELPRHIPVTVVSGGHLSIEQLAEHEQIARASDRGRHLVAKNSGHWVHLDEPDIVIGAIREMLRTDR